MSRKQRIAVVDIPPPPASASNGKGRPPVYPWNDLLAGQSFVVDQNAGTPSLRSMRCYCSWMGGRLGAKFKAHQLDDSKIQVYREW